MNRILIAGVGQLGSRYLQGLASSTEKYEIWCFDLSDTSLKTAHSLWLRTPGSNLHVLRFATSIESLPQKFDLVIVASTADARPTIVQQLANHSEIRFWILEKLLSQSIYGLNLIAKNISSCEMAWVNTPILESPAYKHLHDTFKGKKVSVKVDPISGIACNCIHFIHFVSRISNCYYHLGF